MNVLFLAHCTREKGVFDAIDGVALANEALAAEKSPLRFRLDADRRVCVRRGGKGTARTGPAGAACAASWKFSALSPPNASGQALRDADLFCFPTYYLAENQPGNLIEAMAFGLPIVTTRWRVDSRNAAAGLSRPRGPEIAGANRRRAAAVWPRRDLAASLRENFSRRFTLEQHLAGMAEAIRSVEE